TYYMLQLVLHISSSTHFPYTTHFRSIFKKSTMKKMMLLVIVAFTVCGVSAQELKSPDGKLTMNFKLSEIGTPTYTLSYKNTPVRSEEHTSELQSRENLVCRLLLEKKK